MSCFGLYLFCCYLRTSKLLYASGVIGYLMQIHVEFFMIWRREGKERELGGCFAKQPPHRLKLRTTRPFTHHCTSCYCHTTHNIPFFIPKFRDRVLLRNSKNDNLL
jgi:hypothetical protein